MLKELWDLLRVVAWLVWSGVLVLCGNCITNDMHKRESENESCNKANGCLTTASKSSIKLQFITMAWRYLRKCLFFFLNHTKNVDNGVCYAPSTNLLTPYISGRYFFNFHFTFRQLFFNKHIICSCIFIFRLLFVLATAPRYLTLTYISIAIVWQHSLSCHSLRLSHYTSRY